MQSQGLTARLLEAPQSVRVEGLPPSVVGGTNYSVSWSSRFVCIFRDLLVFYCRKPKNTSAAVDQTLYFLADMLEMYFEETWSQPQNIQMIAEEQAAIVSFSDPEGWYF